jgi:D-alanyl-lipoteichoic acid acyltransferase DltB (MBOAT superfamily)
MRWEICFNLSLLRMLSFALDFHWRRRQHGAVAGAAAATASAKNRAASGQAEPSAKDAKDAKGGSGRQQDALAPRWRQQTALPCEADYSTPLYLAYVLYPPLYLAGPIMSYQDFAWQLRQRPALPASTVRDASPVLHALLTCHKQPRADCTSTSHSCDSACCTSLSAALALQEHRQRSRSL